MLVARWGQRNRNQIVAIKLSSDRREVVYHEDFRLLDLTLAALNQDCETFWQTPMGICCNIATPLGIILSMFDS